MRSTACCTASSSDSICIPIPAPRIEQLASTIVRDEWLSRRLSPTNPAVISRLPRDRRHAVTEPDGHTRGDDRHHDPSEKERGQHLAGLCRGAALNALDEEGNERDGAEHRDTDEKHDHGGARDDRKPQQRQREDRFDCLALREHEPAKENDAGGQPGERRAGVAAERDEQRADAREEQGRAQPVDLHLPGHARARVGQRDHGHAAESEGDVQIEDPTPGQPVRDVASHERTCDRRDTPDAAEERLCLGALRQRVQLADDRHAHRDDRAGAKPLNRSRRDQGEHAGRRAGHHRANQEYRHAEQIHAPSSVQIGEPSPDRDRRGRCEQIRGKYPAVMRQAAERCDDSGHRRADDRRLERPESHPEQEPRGDGLPAAEG